MSAAETVVRTVELDVYYGETHALRDVSFVAPARTVTALIGPSGSGKSTLLRALNRLHDVTPTARVYGHVSIAGIDIYRIDPVLARQRVGMVFQRPNPFPASIFENVAYGLRLRYRKPRSWIAERVEESLRTAYLWDEVKDRLHESGLALSGGQQQRLCVARAVATRPEVVLMDEPTSALDPVATARIEESVLRLRERHCVIVVTHSMPQAARLSDHVVVLHRGDVTEAGPTAEVFASPKQRRTEEFISGWVG